MDGSGSPNPEPEQRAKGAGITNRAPSHVRDTRGAVLVAGDVWEELEPVAVKLGYLYSIPGLERCDVEQIARMAMLEGLGAYDGSTPLRAFARLVAERRVLDALTAAWRHKRVAERTALRVVALESGEEIAACELAPEPVGLELRVQARAELRAVVGAVASLTELEREHLGRAVRGEAYAWTGDRRNKQAENAVDRARAKLRRALAAEHAA